METTTSIPHSSFQWYSGKLIEVKANECIEKVNLHVFMECPEKWKLYIPKVALDILNNQLKSSHFDLRQILTSYRGFKVIEGYELAIILVHEDYALFNNETLISKISL